MTAPDPLLHNVDETAQALRLGRSTTFELIASGAIESIKIGRRRLVPHAALVAFVEQQRNGNSPA